MGNEQVLRCPTEGDYYGVYCFNPTPGLASTTDHSVGVYTDFDNVTQKYSLRFIDPTGNINDQNWYKQPPGSSECAGGYQSHYLFLGAFCSYSGVFHYEFYPTRVGTWTVQVLADGVVRFSEPLVVKSAHLVKSSGDGQSGLINEDARFPLTVTMADFEGRPVSYPIRSDDPDIFLIEYSIAAPGGAGGQAVTPNADYFYSSSSVSVHFGSKPGTYSVKATHRDADPLDPPFQLNALIRLEPEDNKDKEEGNGEEQCTVADPVSIGIGNSFQQETDYVRTGLSPLEFVRSYNALGSKSRSMRNYWTTTFDRAVLLPTAPGDSTRVRRPDGRVIPFALQNGVYASLRPYFHDRLVSSGSGWQYIAEDNTVETYDVQGRWVTIADSVGRVLTATYNTKNLLTVVTANTGESLSFTYNEFSQIVSATDHTGRVWTYKYSGFSNLTQVKDPDGVFHTYHYESPHSPYLLTGISVGRNAIPADAERYVTWAYDSTGRVTENYLRNGLKRYSIVYNDVDGTRVVTDAMNNQSTYRTRTLHGRGFVDGVIGPGFASCGVADSEVQRDINENIVSATRFGKTTTYGGHDGKGQPAFMVEAAGTASARRTDYTYDARFAGKPTSIVQPSVAPGLTRITQIGYDSTGQVSQYAINGYQPDGVPVSRAISVQFNGPYGQVSLIDGPRTDVVDITRLEYDLASKRLRRVVDANNIVQRDNIIYTATGQIAAEDRPNGVRITYAYYPGTDLLKSVTEVASARTRTTTWSYNDRRWVSSITQSDGVSADLVTQFTYNAAGDIVTVASPGVGKIVYTYDDAGNQIRESYQTSGGAEQRWAQRTFDAYGRVKDLINPYASSHTDFHPDGTLSSATDGRSAVTNYGYDDFKRLTQVLQPGALATTMAYDIGDRLVRLTDANQASTHQVFDDLGNRLRLESPDSGVTRFVHDGAGNIVQSIDAMDQLTTYAYDAGGRLTSVDRVDVEDDEAYVYGGCTNGISRLCSVANGIGDYVHYEYDAFGRVSKQTTNAGSVGYLYDAKDNIVEITYPSQRRVLFSRDAAGKVGSVRVADGGNTYVLAREIKYLPFGPATDWVFGNGVTETRLYDTQYRPTSFISAGASTVGYEAYDGNDNVTRRVVNGDAQVFTYDAHDRLDTAAGMFGARDYDYDPVGNRTSLIVVGQTTNYTYQPQSNRLMSDSQWVYERDANGNETKRQGVGGLGWDMVYTANNRLLAVTAIGNPNALLGVYRYNALGQRTVKSTPYGDTRFIYGQGGELLAELLPDGSVVQEYVYLDGAPIALLGVPTTPDAPFGIDQIIDNPPSDPSCSSKNASAAVNGSYLNCPINSSGFSLHWPWAAPASGDYDIYVRWAWASASQCYRFGDGVGTSTCVGAGAVAGSWLLMGRYHLDAGRQEPALDTMANQSQGLSSLRMDATRYVLVHKDLTDRDYKYVHTDAIGTPLRLTDKTGAIVWSAAYDPFGLAMVDEDPDGDGAVQRLNLRFPGQYYDAETGLHYNYFRDYDPERGRYLQSDPIGLAGGLNTYAYVGGDPIRYIDPLGLWELDISSYLFFGVGLNVRYSDGRMEMTGRFGLGLGAGVSLDPTGTVSPHATENCDEFGLIARTSTAGSLGFGLGPLSRGVGAKIATGNAFGRSINDPRFPNFTEASPWGVEADPGRTGWRLGLSASGHIYNPEIGFYRDLGL